MKLIVFIHFIRYMFYTKWLIVGSLERANLDGKNRTTLVYRKIIYPLGLTLDLPKEHLYWVDTYNDAIERIDYEGRFRWSVRKSARSYPIVKSLHSIAMFESTIFVSSWTSGNANHSVVALNKHDSRTAQQIVQHISWPDNIRVFHQQRQPMVSHPCAKDNGGCDQLCIPAWHNKTAVAQCMCSPGYRLQGKAHCVTVRHPSFLIYAKQEPPMIKGIAMSPGNGDQEAILPILNVKWPLSLDYNVKEQSIYFGQHEGYDEIPIFRYCARAIDSYSIFHYFLFGF